MPKKLKRHFINYARFAVVYVVIETLVEAWQQNVGFEHYALIKCGSIAVFIFVTVWFGWRTYTGIERDGDFFTDDY